MQKNSSDPAENQWKKDQVRRLFQQIYKCSQDIGGKVVHHGHHIAPTEEHKTLIIPVALSLFS